jgi:hypothetical protein
MTENETPRKGGRPKGSATGQTKLRTLRIGPLWDRGQTMAKARGLSMTTLVEEALRREVARLERQDQRQAGE